MEVYLPVSAEGFEMCHPQQKEDFETINAEINGTPRECTWRPIPVRLVHEDRGKKLESSDSPWLGSNALIFRRPTIEKLGTLLTCHGEILPLTCSEADLFVFNATRVVDALDENASAVTRFSNGRLMRVNRYVFRNTAIGNADIFKIPNLRVSPTFVSLRLVEAWSSTGLRGLVFKRLW